MEGNRFYSTDYLIRGGVSADNLGHFVGQILSHQPKPEPTITNLAVGVFETCTLRNGEWSQTFCGTSMNLDRVSDDDAGWRPLESSDTSVTFISTARGVEFTPDNKIFFHEGLLTVEGLILATAGHSETSVIDGWSSPTSLTLTEQGQGGDFTTRALLYHEENGFNRSRTVPSITPVSFAMPIAS